MSLDDIKSKVDDLAVKIGAPDKMLPDYGSMKFEAHPYIELDHRGWMYYNVSERGHREEKLAIDLDHFMFMIFDNITFWMASDFELKNRLEDKDCRRMIFAKQEELIGLLSKKWQERKIEEHQRILFSAPFDDLSGLRSSYYRRLRDQGHSNADIEKLAFEKYPRNVK